MVAEIGFLATWWVGFVAAWFIARITVPAFPRRTGIRHTLHGFLIVFVATVTASLVGYLCGMLHSTDYSAWGTFAIRFDITDLPAFVRVAYIHNAGYLGGLIGLIVALIFVRWQRKKETDAQSLAVPTPGTAAERADIR